MATVRRLDLSMQVYELLRERITNLELPPGERIDIPGLSAELSVSPGPIREALKRLTERGLIHTVPGHGYHVVKLSQDDVRHIFELRVQLETFALGETHEVIPQEELAALRQASVKLLSMSEDDPKTLRAFDQTDVRLHHELIVGNSANRFLRGQYDVMSDFSAISRHLQHRLHEALREHIEIIDAIISRDIERAEAMLRVHLQRSSIGYEACNT